MAYHLLIVEDSASMRAVIKKVISLSGVEIGNLLEAENGREALNILSEQWVDLVFTDINMPEMDGIEMLRGMQNDELLKFIPTVVITTEGSESRMREAYSLGVKRFIKKPFLPETIKNVIDEVLGEGR